MADQTIQGKDESEMVPPDDRQSRNEHQRAEIDRTAIRVCGTQLKIIFAIVALFVGFSLTSIALAEDLTVSRTVLKDASGSLTIADVAGRVTTPAAPSLPILSSKTAYWLCLRVKAPANGSKVVLYIRPNYLNDVRLYEAGSGKPLTWKTRATGNHYPYRDRDRAAIALGFVVDVTAPEATYYLRIKTRGPTWVSLEAVEPAEAERKDQQRDLVMVFFATAMLCLLVWAILSHLLDRKPIAGLFAVHQAVYTLFGLVVTGYFAPLVSARFPQVADWAELVLYCAINFTPVLFCRALFKPYAPPPLMMRGLNLLLCTFPVLLVAIALGYDTQAAIANNLLIKFTWLYFVVIAFSLRVERTPSRRLLQLFFVSILVNNAIYYLPGQSSRFASVVKLTPIQILIIDGLVIGGLFAVILHTRARQAQREAQQAALDLVLVQKKFELEQERKQHAEMLAQTDYLTGLYNRRRFVELAKRELERAIRFQRPLTLLMIDVDHFKVINDTWGHSTGDVALQYISRLIRDTLRSVDIFGRTGGDEFAAVLVETEGSNAREIAQRLCCTVADAEITPPDAECIHISISIGISELNGRNIDFNSLLHEADQTMYNAKQAGCDRVAVGEAEKS